jgi:RNA polymerase sigma factor (sigma-70 family)
MSHLESDLSDWETLRSEIRRAARRWRVNSEDLDDLTQEVFLRMLQFGEFVRSRRGWLAVVVRRLAFGLKRTRHRTIALSESRCNVATSPDRHAKLELDLLLQKLPVRDARLLRLLAQGVSHRNIATAMGWHTSDVGTHAARAIDRASLVTHGRNGIRTGKRSQRQKLRNRCVIGGGTFDSRDG